MLLRRHGLDYRRAAATTPSSPARRHAQPGCADAGGRDEICRGLYPPAAFAFAAAAPRTHAIIDDAQRRALARRPSHRPMHAQAANTPAGAPAIPPDVLAHHSRRAPQLGVLADSAARP